MLMNKSMLNMDIYSVENIKKTCNAYKDFARIKIKRNYNYMELTFDRCKYDTCLLYTSPSPRDRG